MKRRKRITPVQLRVLIQIAQTTERMDKDYVQLEGINRRTLESLVEKDLIYWGEDNGTSLKLLSDGWLILGLNWAAQTSSALS